MASSQLAKVHGSGAIVALSGSLEIGLASAQQISLICPVKALNSNLTWIGLKKAGSKRWPARRIAAFTLVEIMIVVVIIGLLAALAIPAFQRSRERTFVSRLTNDFRQYESSFARYAIENGQFPAAAGAGVIPAGMAGYLPNSFTETSVMGGLFQWSGPSNYVVLRGGNATDQVMQRVDLALDDGDLTTGEFVKLGAIGYAYRVR